MIRKIGENRGKPKDILKSEGYSEGYIRSGEIKNTKSWKIVSEALLPNVLLAKVNVGLLKHKAWQARSSGLDKAYRAKKIYSNAFEITDKRKYGDYSKEQLAEEVARRTVGFLRGGRRKTGGGEK